MEGSISSSFHKQHTCTSDQTATELEKSPGSHFFVMCCLFVQNDCQKRHKRRNNPVCKLKSSLTQQFYRMRRAWKENEGKTTTPQNWRGQLSGATQRIPLLPEHTQPMKWVKVKFEIWHRGSKSFFYETKLAGFKLPSMITSCPVELRVWWSGLVGTWWPASQGLPATLHLHPLKDIPDLWKQVCGN